MRIDELELGFAYVTVHNKEPSSHHRGRKWLIFKPIDVDCESSEEDGVEILIVFFTQALVLWKQLLDECQAVLDDFLEKHHVDPVVLDDGADGSGSSLEVSSNANFGFLAVELLSPSFWPKCF